MVDVQGFIWCVFSIPDVWFGGVKYGDEDMLPRFQAARVYAVGFGAEPGVRSLIAGAAELPLDERKLRAQAIAGAAENASAALANLIELAARPGSIVLAKAAYADAKAKVSIVHVRGIARTGKPPTGYDDALGQSISVEWLGSTPTSGSRPRRSTRSRGRWRRSSWPTPSTSSAARKPAPPRRQGALQARRPRRRQGRRPRCRPLRPWRSRPCRRT